MADRKAPPTVSISSAPVLCGRRQATPAHRFGGAGGNSRSLRQDHLLNPGQIFGAGEGLVDHLHAGPGHAVVGLDVNCTHHRGVTEGMVTAVATPLAEGRTIASYQITVVDDRDRPVATARLTCLIRPLPAA